MAPQISIITPCLNQAPFLPQTLVSVAGQKGVAHEHLIFDPGSYDGSRALIKAHARATPNVRAFLERDGGPADAISKGVARSQSEFIAWIGGDDVYLEDTALAQMVAVLRQRPEIDVVYARSALIGGDGKVLSEQAAFATKPAQIAAELAHGEAFVGCAALFRRRHSERWEPVRPQAGLAYDYDFWLRAAKAGAKFAALDAKLVGKRQRVESAARLLGGARAMACARVTRMVLGQASDTWIARAVDADVGLPEGPTAQSRDQAVENVCAGTRRRFASAGRGEALVLLGNGPSLRDFDFTSLSGLDTLGMNAAYRHWREIGWCPRYYACLDTIVGMSHRQEIEAMILNAEQLGIELFLLRQNLIDALSSAARQSARVVDFDAIAGEGGLLDVEPLTTGSHAALFGALLGYQNILLLGVDANYVEVVAGAQLREGTVLELTSQPADNPNYFFEGYQTVGDRYNVPNPIPNLHVQCWRSVGARLAPRGVRIWNGSATSNVDAFPRRSFAQFQAAIG